VLVFRPLGRETMTAIAEKYLEQLCSRARSQGIRLRLPGELAELLAGECTGKAGARGLRSLIQTRVEGPLSTFLLTRAAAPAAVSGALVGEELVFSE